MTTHRNIFGQPLQICGSDPVTGFFRTGCCEVDGTDRGVHAVCAQMTPEFLAFTKGRGNDLSTPRPEFGFPGLKPGDRWCLCAARWREALAAGCAPPVYLACTHERALDVVSLDDLKANALDMA